MVMLNVHGRDPSQSVPIAVTKYPMKLAERGAKFILAHGLRGFWAGLPYFGDCGEAEHRAEAMCMWGVKLPLRKQRGREDRVN